MRLDEILNTQHLPYKWLTPNIGVFEFNDKLFGIILEDQIVDIGTRKISIVNVLFGIVIHPQQSIDTDNINTDLTNFGQPRAVMSTVGRACVENHHIKQYDVIILAASDQAQHKRSRIYALGLMELNTHLPEYKYRYDAHPKGVILTITSKIEFTLEEIEYIGTKILDK